MTATTAEDSQTTKDEAEDLKRRIAELLVECKGNPFIGELMGPGLHPGGTSAGSKSMDRPRESRLVATAR